MADDTKEQIDRNAAAAKGATDQAASSAKSATDRVADAAKGATDTLRQGAEKARDAFQDHLVEPAKRAAKRSRNRVSGWPRAVRRSAAS